jgi:uncharacterized protein YndB with AHSA1/START domain
MGANNIQVDKDKLTVSMERVFNAPKELVWKAHTTPELIQKWWGTDDSEMVVDKMDVREGGEWRFVNKPSLAANATKMNGQEYAFHGTYRKVDAPNSLTWTFNFEPIGPGHELTETIIFEDMGDGKTKIKTTSQFLTIQDMEGMMSQGMETGATQSWNRLEKLLQSMK